MGHSALADALARVEGIAAVVRDGALESERLGRLTPAVVDALHAAGLFRIAVPKEFGGSDLTLPESTAVLERVASLDAATGWTLAILADGPLFARRLSPSARDTILSDPLGLACGSLNPLTAQAEAIDGGFRVSGRATYLSGSAHAKWMMATAIVMRDGAPIVDAAGIAIRACVFPIDRARCLDTWNVSGMRATGSHDYEFDGVEVDEGWTFEPFQPSAAAGDDVFARIPLWSQLGGALAAVAVGATRNMIERFVELAVVKVPLGGNFSVLAERAAAQTAVGEAQGLYQAARAVLMETAENVWRRGVAGDPFDNDVQARDRVGSVTAVRLAAQAVDLLHDAAGMTAVAADGALDRCWRDVHTMTQHIMLAPGRFEIAGRVIMGLDPASPVI